MSNDVKKKSNGSDLTVLETVSTLPMVNKQYKGMLKHINETMPAIQKSSSNFYKSHSQFMNTMLDVTAITPVRSVKHTLAEIDKTKQALEEAHIKLRKKQIDMKEKEDILKDIEASDIEKDRAEIELIELQVQEKNIGNGITGAIRKLSYFTTQYQSILKKLGKETITEEEYEDEEENYHIMTCMKQALNAARARGGMIDEGNLIYLFDMGINSAVAQQEILGYLKKENDMMANGGTPTHEMTMQGDSIKFAERRGFQLKDSKSLNLLEDKKENDNGEQNN